METIIIGFIGVSTAVYLLHRGFKAFAGKTEDSCSGGGCCSGKQCFEKKRNKN